MKLSYRTLFILIMMLFGLVFLAFYSVTFYYQHSADVSDISIEHFENKSKERLNFVNFFAERFPKTLNAIENNETFQHYINTGEDRESVENLFLSLQKSVTCTMQIRYLDMLGMEKIRTDSTGTADTRSPTIHRITPQDELQDKSHRGYFQTFKKLKPNELGISDVELNMEFGKIVEPKQPTLRFSKVVYDQDQNAQGMLIINVCLTQFFEQLQKTTLYHVYIVDKNGRFILYKEPQKSLMGNDYEKFSVYEAYGLESAHAILTQPQYFGRTFFSTPMTSFSQSQGLKMILELKFDQLSEEVHETTQLILAMVVLTILLMLPVAIYLSRFPDRLMNKLDSAAHIDGLTGLPNKTSLFENMRERNDCVLILLRIDNLRDINNVYGYLLADELIKELGQRLLAFSKALKFDVYKLPSNLFAITLPYQSHEHLHEIMHTIHNRIEESAFRVKDEHEFMLSVTLGASDPNEELALTEMLIDAEKAMHAALDQKVGFAILNTQIDLKQQYQHNIFMLEVIRQALQNDSVLAFFQPIHNNRTHQVEKYEVLMRLQDQQGVIYPPHTFLDIAKASKYYHQLTLAVIEQAVRYFENEPYEFSVNISYEDILNPGFLSFLQKLFERYPIEDRIVFEIVETEGLGDYDQVFEFISSIKKMGCKVAIDDFGTGYSNFEHLLRLRNFIDYIKIDGSLIKNIDQNETNLAIVQSIKAFCDNLNIKTIAEFVSDESLQSKVLEVGVDYSQGFYFGQPHNELLNREETHHHDAHA